MSLIVKAFIKFFLFFIAGIVLMVIGISWYGEKIIQPYLREHKEVKDSTNLKHFLITCIGFILLSVSITLPIAKDTYSYTITAEVMAYNDFNTFFKTDNGDIYETDGHYGNGIYILQMNRNNTWKTEDDYIELVYLAVDGCYADGSVG